MTTKKTEMYHLITLCDIDGVTIDHLNKEQLEKKLAREVECFGKKPEVVEPDGWVTGYSMSQLLYESDKPYAMLVIKGGEITVPEFEMECSVKVK